MATVEQIYNFKPSDSVSSDSSLEEEFFEEGVIRLDDSYFARFKNFLFNRRGLCLATVCSLVVVFIMLAKLYIGKREAAKKYHASKTSVPNTDVEHIGRDEEGVGIYKQIPVDHAKSVIPLYDHNRTIVSLLTKVSTVNGPMWVTTTHSTKIPLYALIDNKLKEVKPLVPVRSAFDISGISVKDFDISGISALPVSDDIISTGNFYAIYINPLSGKVQFGGSSYMVDDGEIYHRLSTENHNCGAPYLCAKTLKVIGIHTFGNDARGYNGGSVFINNMFNDDYTRESEGKGSLVNHRLRGARIREIEKGRERPFTARTRAHNPKAADGWIRRVEKATGAVPIPRETINEILEWYNKFHDQFGMFPVAVKNSYNMDVQATLALIPDRIDKVDAEYEMNQFNDHFGTISRDKNRNWVFSIEELAFVNKISNPTKGQLNYLRQQNERFKAKKGIWNPHWTEEQKKQYWKDYNELYKASTRLYDSRKTNKNFQEQVDQMREKWSNFYKQYEGTPAMVGLPPQLRENEGLLEVLDSDEVYHTHTPTDAISFINDILDMYQYGEDVDLKYRDYRLDVNGEIDYDDSTIKKVVIKSSAGRVIKPFDGVRLAEGTISVREQQGIRCYKKGDEKTHSLNPTLISEPYEHVVAIGYIAKGNKVAKIPKFDSLTTSQKLKRSQLPYVHPFTQAFPDIAKRIQRNASWFPALKTDKAFQLRREKYDTPKDFAFLTDPIWVCARDIIGCVDDWYSINVSRGFYCNRDPLNNSIQRKIRKWADLQVGA